MKDFNVLIDFSPIEIKVKAKNKREAKKKGIAKLRRMNPISLVKKQWPSNRRDIEIEDWF